MVYEAYDQVRGIHVALKTLRHPTQDASFRLKQEFRRLSGLDHINLCNLYDLHVSSEETFFTMELIPGDDFLAAVRKDSDFAFHKTLSLEKTQEVVSKPVASYAFDEDRVRALLPQIASGLHALHCSGKIHRDIKPSNIRVTPEGVVKILDFGLAMRIRDTTLDPSSNLHSGEIVGTLSYMSPEQASSEPRLGPATDWYAFGVLLYQAISGSLPFEGKALQVLAKKTQEDAPSLARLCPDAPRDLCELCDNLLQRDPASRFHGREILHAVCAKPPLSQPTNEQSLPLPFFGRKTELETISDAMESVVATRSARTVVISGPSGIGKTAIAEQAMDAFIQQWPGFLALRGRCYEWETVPFKAMDGVIDELSTHWRDLDRSDAQRLLPSEPHVLPVLFPVLDRVAAVASSRSGPPPDLTQTLRDRALSAIRETLNKLSAQQTVVLFLDDMQWADEDTLSLLRCLLQQPREPALLLVLTTRPQGLRPLSPLGDFLKDQEDTTVHLRLSPLSTDESVHAAKHLLSSESVHLAADVAKEARGNPFFLSELIYSINHKSREGGSGCDVDELIQSRVQAFAEEERQLLQYLCIASEPLTPQIAQRAIGLSAAQIATASKRLRHHNLACSIESDAHHNIAPYHDRVRKAVVALYSPEQIRQTHASIANALQSLAPHAPTAIVRHWLLAEQPKQSVQWANLAAEQAMAQLDFRRAADFYEVALVHGQLPRSEKIALLVKCGEALSEAGRPGEAAIVYKRALQEEHGNSITLRRLVTENLLLTGDTEAALSSARQLTKELSLRHPTNTASTIVHLLAGEADLKWRNLCPPAASSPPSREAAIRADVAESLARGLSSHDVLYSGVFTQQWARASLKLASPPRCARALSSLAILTSMRDASGRSRQLISAAQKWAKRDKNSASEAYVSAARAFAAYYLENDWAQTHTELQVCRKQWQDAGRGHSHEMGLVHLMTSMAHSYQGEMRKLNEEVPRVVETARRNGNIFLEISIRASFAHRFLAQDNATKAKEEFVWLRKHWGSHFTVQQWFGMLRECESLVYNGEPALALQLLDKNRPNMRNTLISQLHMIQAEYLQIEARARLALPAKNSHHTSTRSRLRISRIRQWLHKSKRGLPKAWACLLDASLSSRQQHHPQTMHHLRLAEQGFQAIGSNLYLHATRRRMGEQMNSLLGKKLMAKSDLWMIRQGIVNPTQMTHMLIPGLQAPA